MDAIVGVGCYCVLFAWFAFNSVALTFLLFCFICLLCWFSCLLCCFSVCGWLICVGRLRWLLRVCLGFVIGVACCRADFVLIVFVFGVLCCCGYTFYLGGCLLLGGYLGCRCLLGVVTGGLFLGFRLLHSWGVWFLFNFSCCVVCGFDGCLWVHSFVIWVLA